MAAVRLNSDALRAERVSLTPERARRLASRLLSQRPSGQFAESGPRIWDRVIWCRACACACASGGLAGA